MSSKTDTALQSTAFSGASGCAGLAKSVKFELSAAPFTVEISGATAHALSFVVTPDRNHAPHKGDANACHRFNLPADLQNCLCWRATGLLAAGPLLLPAPPASAAGKVNVLYAGSLVNLMEHGVGAGLRQGERRHLPGLCRRLERARQPDQGQAPPRRRIHQRQPQGQRRSDRRRQRRLGELVHHLRAIPARHRLQSHRANLPPTSRSKPWYEVLQEPGIKIGRTDPKLDPKGALTVTLMQQGGDVLQEPRACRRRCSARPTIPRRCCRRKRWSAACNRASSMSASSIRPRPPDAKIPAIALAARNRAEGGLHRHDPARCAERRRRRQVRGVPAWAPRDRA